MQEKDLHFLSCLQSKHGYICTKMKGAQVNIQTIFLPACTCCAYVYVFLNTTTIICTCKTAPNTLLSAKSQVQESVQTASLKESTAHTTMGKSRGTSSIQGTWLVP